MISELGTRARTWGRGLSHPVIAVALGLVALQTVFRAWALYPSWFYTDDYRLLYDATHSDLSVSYLLEPFDSQFMPFGRFVAWVVAESGQLNWAVAATITVFLQLLASLAFVWMLVTLFGRRWGILTPLIIYLTSALTVPALMWWAASLNQLPLQIALPLAVGTWVNHLRTGNTKWLVGSLAIVAVGLIAYVKAVLILPLLAYLMVALFCTGSVRARLGQAIGKFWRAGIAFVALGLAFTVYYTTQVPSVLDGVTRGTGTSLARTMLGESLPTGLIGGPIEWALLNPPVATSAAPGLLAVVAWMVVAALVAHTWLTRERTGRVWLLLVAYAGAAYVVLLTSRAGSVGGEIGHELRYLTDVLPVAALCLGLATMGVVGAPDATAEREQPLLISRWGAGWTAAATALVACLGLLSTVRYVDGWHHENPGADYLHNARKSIAEWNDPALASQPVPANVIPGYSAPYNLTDHLLPLAMDDVRFPEVTDRLLVLDQSGDVGVALIDAGAVGLAGPVPDCGWRVSSGSPQSIPLDRTTIDWDWWVRLSYLASANSPATVRVGNQTFSTQVRRGLNNLYVRVEGAFDRVEVGGLAGDAVVCVSTVEVGEAVSGRDL